MGEGAEGGSFCLVPGEAAPTGRFRESSRAHLLEGSGKVLGRPRCRCTQRACASCAPARGQVPLGSPRALHPYEPHEQRGVARAFEGWDEWAAACVKTIKGRMLTTTMKKKVTLLMMMLTRVGMRMVTRMVVRMVMAARMLVKTVTMMVMLTTARGLIMLMLCGDGDEGQGARHLSARAPSRSFSLIESTHASIPRMNKYAIGERDARLAAYAHAMQAVLEAGEVADGGGRPRTRAQGPAADVFASLRGVYWGMIPGGDGLVSWRCCVCWGLAWDGWLAGLELTDGHLRGQTGCDSHGIRLPAAIARAAP